MSSFEEMEKLEEVFKLFLLPNYNILSTTYLDLLLTQIANDKTELRRKHNTFFRIWVPKALNTWKFGQKPCQAVISFIVKLVGLIAQDELHFQYWNIQDVYPQLCTIFGLRNPDIPASIKMAYTSMVYNLIQHSSGRSWVQDSGAWIDIVRFAQLNHTLYVTRESQKIVWKLLLHESDDINFCTNIILAVVKPLTENSHNAQSHVILEEHYMSENALLCTTLDLLTCIYENTLFHSMDNTIPTLIEKVANLEARVKALFEACISTRFLQHISKLLLLTLFKSLKDGVTDITKPVDPRTSEKFRQGLSYIIMLMLPKKYILDIVRMNKYCLIYWTKLKSLCALSLGLPHKFEHQIICLMLIPLSSTFGQQNNDSDFFENYVNKIFDITSTKVQRLAYNMRDVILKNNDLPMEKITKYAVEMVLELMENLDRDVAIICFQTFCYVLKNYTIDRDSEDFKKLLRERQRNPSYRLLLLEGDPITEKPLLLSSLLDGLALLTKKFKLKWQECVETICILSLAQQILDHTGVQSSICVKALRLCQLAIQNFMPPNLALLVDSESHMNEIGPTLFKRIHDPNWEVVDSVFEVLITIGTISEDKYPAFQNFIIKYKFLPVAISIATSDGESYVRASALIFIATSVKMDKLWSSVLYKFELPAKAIDLINNESEAIVRKEAVALLTQLYIHRQWPKSIIDVISSAMTVASVLDLHWEVKVNSLSYWQSFIMSHLTDQGMLDGSFPNVTFSKEHRKIVQLNETEIKRRINKALDDLTKNNCLGVLLSTLRDESDFEVSRASAEIINNLKSFIIKYKVHEPIPEVLSPKDSAIADTSYVRPPNLINDGSGKRPQDYTDVIEDIINKNDTNLLSEIYDKSMKVEDNKSNEAALNKIPYVTRQEFLQEILTNDINAYIEKRKTWLTTYTSSFDSILNDILMLYQQKDVISMDCY